MTKEWTFDQELDSNGSSPAEERAKIAALFGKTDGTEGLDYGAAFQQQKQAPVKQVAPQKVESKPQLTPPSQPMPTDITSSYQAHLKRLMADNKDDVAISQKKIEELHSLIDSKNKENKQLQAIYDAIAALN